MSILLGGKPPSDVSSLWVDSPAASAKTPAPKAEAITADAATQAALATFLRDYHRALSTGDAAYLTEHTVFPLPIAELVYDMEVKIEHSKLATAAALVQAKGRVLWPAELLPDGPQALRGLRKGLVNCANLKPTDKPDFTQGEPAIQLHGDEASLTYMAEFCDAEAHVAILSFVRSGQTWRLRDRSVRRGAR